MIIEVFIENEAGKATKNIYDEKLLVWQGSVAVSRPYPLPYGFVTNTTAPDRDNVDCFVISRNALSQGQKVNCEPIGLLEQIEDEQIDHKVLARPVGEDGTVTEVIIETLRDFIEHVFEHLPEKRIAAGAIRDAAFAATYLKEHLDDGTSEAGLC